MENVKKNSRDTFAACFRKSREDIQNYGEEFKRIFGWNLKDFYGSNALGMALGFDMILFNNRLSEAKYEGRLDDLDISIAMAVTEHYGDKARALIWRLL